MSKPMKGKVAVVTGGANGIGFATVQRLAREGADIAILDREDGPLQEAAAFVKKEGGRALPMAVDMLKPPAVAEATLPATSELSEVVSRLASTPEAAISEPFLSTTRIVLARESWCSLSVTSWISDISCSNITDCGCDMFKTALLITGGGRLRT